MPRAALGTGWGLLLPRRSAVASWQARRRRPRLAGLRLLVLGSPLAACGQSCASLSDGKCPLSVRFWTNRAATPLLRNTSTPKRAPVAYIVTPEGPLPITDEPKRRSHCRRKRLPELFHRGHAAEKAQCNAALNNDGGSGGDGTSPPAFSLNLFSQKRPTVMSTAPRARCRDFVQPDSSGPAGLKLVAVTRIVVGDAGRGVCYCGTKPVPVRLKTKPELLVPPPYTAP